MAFGSVGGVVESGFVVVGKEELWAVPAESAARREDKRGGGEDAAEKMDRVSMAQARTSGQSRVLRCGAVAGARLGG